ncbi:BCCT family transporter [Alcanivorax sp.]|jgi:glycine betaine transporter|uniref:BCCT family transporter n=1 Tax=Alcanivorax sp. TaxID=1872427 RepID=UPI0039E3CC41
MSFLSRTFQAVDVPVFILSGGLILLFVGLSLWDIEQTAAWVQTSFAWSTKLFGAYWQLLMLATFFVSLYLAISRTGNVRLGGMDKPELSTFKWVSIIMCTLLAGGGVFWAAAEPIAHFISAPPLFGEGNTPMEQGTNALAQSFMHWGFLAWAILGCLTSVTLMVLHYEKGLPLKPRTLLYPVFGDRIIHGAGGAIVDACCVLAVVAGTVGPIGFLGLQVSFGLNDLFGIADTFRTQLAVILGLVCIYTISAITGVNRGIQILSRFNVLLAIALMAFILIAGPTAFIIDGFVQGLGTYLGDFFPMATFRGDPGWLDWWTVFFWGWFIGYGPLMALFVARISRGRTLRQLVGVVALVAPLVTCFWFTIVGGTGISLEIAQPGIISQPFEGFNLPAALLATTQALPWGTLLSGLFLVLTTIFVATTGDSMTYSVSVVMTGTEEPPSAIRVFWGIMMGASAAILISIGDGGIDALQKFIVVTAVPVSLVLLPSLWTGPALAGELLRKQQA